MTGRAMAARSGETGTGSTVGNSAVANGDGPQTTDNRENIVTTSEQQAVPVAQEARRLALIERIGTIADLACTTPLTGELGDVAYDLLRQAAAQISSDRLYINRLASLPCKSDEGAGEALVKIASALGDFDAAKIDSVTVTRRIGNALHMAGAKWDNSQRRYGFATPATIVSDRFPFPMTAFYDTAFKDGRDDDYNPDAAITRHALTPDATQTREAELVAALEPFVKHWQPWMDATDANDNGEYNWPDTNEMSYFARVTYGDLRRARAALNGRGGA